MRTPLGALLLLSGCEAPPAAGECTTGEVWTGGDEESPLMHPGGDCIGCHADEREGPQYTLAGTVMGALDEATDCYGVQGVTVTITDNNDDVLELTTNAAGNFFTREPIAMPYTVVIELDGEERPMGAAQTDGNCATCHTETGAEGAPGRVLVPGI